MHNTRLAQVDEVATHNEKSDLAISVSMVQDRKRLGTRALSILRELNTNHQRFKCSNIHSNSCVDEATAKRTNWNAFPQRVRRSSHAREYDFGVQPSLSHQEQEVS